MRELHSLPSPSATSRRQGRRPRLRPRRRAAALLAALAAAGVLAACSSSSTNPSVAASAPAPSESATASEGTASPSPAGSPSAAPTADASVAASFAASVSAQEAQTQAKAASVLADLPGGGNALDSVTLAPVPLSDSGGLPAVVATIENQGINAASYAVQVDFTDTAGRAVDSTVVGAEHVPVGEQAAPIAFSRTPAQQRLLPVVVKAVRY